MWHFWHRTARLDLGSNSPQSLQVLPAFLLWQAQQRFVAALVPSGRSVPQSEHFGRPVRWAIQQVRHCFERRFASGLPQVGHGGCMLLPR
jgi:hypothetical protein